MEMILKKKPDTFEAIRFDGTIESVEAVAAWLENRGVTTSYNPIRKTVGFTGYNRDSERGVHYEVSRGEWILEDFVNQHFEVLDNDTLEHRYEAV